MFPNHNPTPVEQLNQEFFNTATCLPRLLRECKLIRAGNKRNMAREQLIAELIDLQIYLDNCVETLRAVSSEPWETLSSHGDELLPFVYMFENNYSASLFCYCASFSLITRRLIAELRVPGWDFSALRNNLIENICKTVEYATSKKAGVFGLFFITFNLRIAYSIAKDPLRSWIMEKLTYIAKVMPVALPDPNEDEWNAIEEVDSEEEAVIA